uniref:AlNc14C47G3762 protein n=1 Tax=Albugo laibachii Nc14 TaxID=890382 RepID=F0WAP8_9STRA|nr:AlNc14C47G3762 [Albugo laibachii Nc14]|eukprot:CCA18219.1 AlNc14C47G3762 [Albugo laibachii Nc14]
MYFALHKVFHQQIVQIEDYEQYIKTSYIDSLFSVHLSVILKCREITRNILRDVVLLCTHLTWYEFLVSIPLMRLEYHANNASISILI